MEDQNRNALFADLKNFSQRKLKKVETKVVTGTGENLVEKRSPKGLQVLSGADASSGSEAEPARKLDLQVGLIVPGLLLASQDVAHDKSSLDSYGVSHILNLASEVSNQYEDDYNYKNINIQDAASYELDRVFDDCFDFIDDGRHYGNVLVHCAGTVGLSRSTAICIAYLMDKEKQSYNDAFNNVREARSFVKPGEHFVKQLKDYEVKLRGSQKAKEAGIDDPFALRKKQEIEQEKAMVAGATSVKNRLKMFGATLDTNSSTTQNSNATNRSKSVSPSPFKSSSRAGDRDSPVAASPAIVAPSKVASKWAPVSTEPGAKPLSSISKSMTPEPRRSWQTQPAEVPAVSGPPPPPPPMPKSLMADMKPAPGKQAEQQPPPAATSEVEASDSARMVFGRVRPPAMKIKGGLSIERNDTVGDRNSGLVKSSVQPKSSLQLPLKKQPTMDAAGHRGSREPSGEERAPSPSAALRAAKQQAAAGVQTSTDCRQSVSGQLNRSSTKKLLNLIKTKTKTDLTLADGDENDEIEALLGALESESVDNIDWDELGLDEDEVKNIIKQGAENSSGSASSSSSSDNDEDDEEDGELEQVEHQHYVIRTNRV